MLPSKLSMGVFLGLSIGLFTGLLTGCFSQRDAVAHQPILKINTTEISTQEFSDRLARQMKSYDSLQVKDETNLKRAKVLTEQSFVIEVITREFAAKNKISVSSEDVEMASKRLRSTYPDDLSFRRALADENLAYETWEKDLTFSLLQKKVFDYVVKDVPEPSEKEIRDYYDANQTKFQRLARVQLRQIVLEKEDNARRILQELSSGGDLAKLAKQYSVAPEGENGGLTDWIEKGTLDVFDSAFKMPLKTPSKILRSPYGYHIFEVIKKEPEAHLSFSEAKAKIKTLLKERKNQEAFSTWLEQQVRHSSVLRNDGLLQAIKVSTRGN